MPSVVGAAELEQMVLEHDAFVLDCDGVLWHGLELLPNVKETLDELRRRGKHIRFVSNNSTKSRAQYVEKCASLGLESKIEEMVPASYAAAEYIKRHHPEVKKALVIGAEGLAAEIRHVAGIKTVNAQSLLVDGDHALHTQAAGRALALDMDVGAVVVGWDSTLTYSHVALATMMLLEIPGCVFVATNLDAGIIAGETDQGVRRLMPGNGAAVAAIQTATGMAPVVTGKPSAFLVELLEEQGLDMSRTVVVGDRLDTDIALGIRGNATSLCVLSGVTSPELVDAETTNKPTHVAENFGAIGQSLTATK
eukprot:m.55413 g.55413  ORF g.55413 m.55413 type:complete len:308 (+) comp12529_c0_seq1:270-1193(+)